MTDSGSRYWAVMPAAGAGKRMESDIPKQYLQIKGKSVIEHSLEVLITHSLIEMVVVAISEKDKHWSELPVSSHSLVRSVPGGKERCHSVLNCLEFLDTQASPEDWVMVHDAARPCVRSDDIDKLITELAGTRGGLLALPVRDTMKRARGNLVQETIEREGLWHALTPQMFRLKDLKKALKQIISREGIVTDESQAMEFAGYSPRLVEGRAENIKVTRQADLALAELYL